MALGHTLRGGGQWWLLEAAPQVLAGLGAVAAATAVADAAGAPRHHVTGIVIVAAGVLAASLRLRWPAAAVTAGVGWLFFDGFVIGEHGVLGWDGSLEWWWLGALAGAAACGRGLALWFAVGRNR